MAKKKSDNKRKKKAYGNESSEQAWERQYRSNLHKIVKLMKKVNLTDAHLDLLKTTPFYRFFVPFINKVVDLKYVIGTQDGVYDILSTRDKRTGAFFIGGKKIVITPTEFDLIFGIQSGHKSIDRKGTVGTDTSLGARKFPR